MAKLTINEAAAGFTHKYAFDYIDLQRTGFLSTIGAANQFRAGRIPSGGIIDTAVVYRVVTAAGASNITLDFGVTGADPDELIDNGDIDGMTQILFNTGDAFIGTDSGAATTSNVINGYANNTTAGVDLLVEVNGTVANLTAGSWVLAWRQMDPPTS